LDASLGVATTAIEAIAPRPIAGADLGGTDCSPSNYLPWLWGLRSRYLHTPTIIPAKKPLLDLYGDFVQPFLGTICPVHLIPNVCFQGLYAVFSCFELSRQLLSEIQTLVGSFSQPYWLRGEPSPGSSAPQPLADQQR
jgi:hypothetical protein